MTGRVRGFRVSLFGVHLAVVSDSAAIAEALDRYVMPWLPREAVGWAAADGLVEVRRAGDGDELEILIDPSGRVVNARVVRSIPLLDAAALQTVYQWVFSPAMKDGRPVATRAMAPVTFRIF